MVAVDRGEVGIVALERLAVAEDGAQPCEALITGDVGGATFKVGRILSGSLGRLARLRWTFGRALAAGNQIRRFAGNASDTAPLCTFCQLILAEGARGLYLTTGRARETSSAAAPPTAATSPAAATSTTAAAMHGPDTEPIKAVMLVTEPVIDVVVLTEPVLDVEFCNGHSIASSRSGIPQTLPQLGPPAAGRRNYCLKRRRVGARANERQRPIFQLRPTSDRLSDFICDTNSAGPI